MFATRYFPDRYFAPRYFAKRGASETVVPAPVPDAQVLGGRLFISPRFMRQLRDDDELVTIITALVSAGVFDG